MRFYAILLLMLSSIVFAQPSAEPVPNQFLRGRSLVILAANFSIDAPSDEWRWDLLHPGKPDPSTFGIYVCVGPDEYFLINVNRFKAIRIDETFLKGFLASAGQSSPDIAASIKYRDVDIPVKGSVRYTYSQKTQQGIIYTTGYIVATTNALTISAQSLSPTESPVFTSFVKSLKLLKPVTNK